MKDQVGNKLVKLVIGDRVATDITSTKRTRLQVGLISEAEGDTIKVSYKRPSARYDHEAKKYVRIEVTKSVWRHSEYVVKVAG